MLGDRAAGRRRRRSRRRERRGRGRAGCAGRGALAALPAGRLLPCRPPGPARAAWHPRPARSRLEAGAASTWPGRWTARSPTRPGVADTVRRGRAGLAAAVGEAARTGGRRGLADWPPLAVGEPGLSDGRWRVEPDPADWLEAVPGRLSGLMPSRCWFTALTMGPDGGRDGVGHRLEAARDPDNVVSPESNDGWPPVAASACRREGQEQADPAARDRKSRRPANDAARIRFRHRQLPVAGKLIPCHTDARPVGY